MNNISFPVSLKFKIGTLANDFRAEDANGLCLAYVRQKMFQLKEKVAVYTDDSRQELVYEIKASKWLDFNTSYEFYKVSSEQKIGRVLRKGWVSIWRAKYEIYDENDHQDLIIKEKNPWIKVIDSLMGELPIIGIFTGYMFNPTYNVTRPDGTLVVKLKKESSFFGRKFTIVKIDNFEPGEETRIILGLMMMILLERRRG